MARKLQLVSELAGQTARNITRDVDGWKQYLDTASRLYKYKFDEQLLIYAQRPDATACAEMELWNEKMRRWVKAGSKGIALIVVRQIICIYFLHIKCTRFWCSLEERSKLLHLFAQFIWDCFGAVLYKQFLPFFFFQRLEP